MSCRTTSGGSASLSLARIVSGLPESDVQHLFHALKREGEGQSRPSEFAIREWRARQEEMLDTNTRVPEARKESLRTRLFRSREEPTPDGAMFYAWSRIEHRARQEAAIRSITTAVDLDPPGSQADQYELGEDGRPTHVMYASYGSNLHRDRFMTYIEGGSPEGSRRVYPGCTDPTAPEVDIPIRYHGGYRAHFALSSSVWHGGIAFMDRTDDEDATALGRAYKLPIGSFDEVVHFENGGFTAATARPVPLDGVLAKGRHQTGDGAYETLMHIGDYNGMPVLTFTAPFTAQEALTNSGRLNRNKVSLPVRTNKPSAAYCRMIGNGLQETFGMSEVQAADYLRGMPGGDKYSRREMVAILRNKDEQDTTAGREKSVGYTPSTDRQPTLPVFAPPATSDAMSKSDLRAWMERTHEVNGNNDRARRTSSYSTPDPRRGTSGNAAYDTPLAAVKTYTTIEDHEAGVRRWTTTRDQWRNNVEANEARLADPTLSEGEKSKVKIRLNSARDRLAEAEARLGEAKSQVVTNHFSSVDAWTPKDWARIASRERQIADHARKRASAAEKDGDPNADELVSDWVRAADRAEEAERKAAQAKELAAAAKPPRRGKGKGKGSRRRADSPSAGLPGVRTYRDKAEQEEGVYGWERRLAREQEILAHTERVGQDATRLRKRIEVIEERLGRAKAQTPPEQAPPLRLPKAAATRLTRSITEVGRVPGVKTYGDVSEQRDGVRRWQGSLAAHEDVLQRARAAGLPQEVIAQQEATVATFRERVEAATAQTPPKVSPGRMRFLTEQVTENRPVPAVTRYTHDWYVTREVESWEWEVGAARRLLTTLTEGGASEDVLALQRTRVATVESRLSEAKAIKAADPMERAKEQVGRLTETRAATPSGGQRRFVGPFEARPVEMHEHALSTTRIPGVKAYTSERDRAKGVTQWGDKVRVEKQWLAAMEARRDVLSDQTIKAQQRRVATMESRLAEATAQQVPTAPVNSARSPRGSRSGALGGGRGSAPTPRRPPPRGLPARAPGGGPAAGRGGAAGSPAPPPSAPHGSPRSRPPPHRPRSSSATSAGWKRSARP